MKNTHKIIRITTIPLSLNVLLKGQLRFIKDYYNLLAIASGPEGELVQVANREGIPTQRIEMTRAITPLQDIKVVWRLYKLFKKEKPQIVHTHTPKAGTLGMMAACFCGVPVRLHTVAGLPLLEAKGFKRFVLNTVEKITYACATKVYPNSMVLKDIIFQNNFCRPSKLTVIGNGSSNGIDTNHFSRQQISEDVIKEIKKENRLNEADFVFIYVGRLVKDKGISELVVAFKKIHQKHSHAKLVLVGNPEPELNPLLPETEQVIKETSAIIIIGFQEDVRPFLAVSNALVFPSYREGFPNVPMQAGAMGLPSIVTNINGCNEIIKNGKNGIIIPPKNTTELEKAMLSMLEYPDLTQRLAANARESIVSRFNQLWLWEQIKAEYDEQLQKAGLI